jgi:hypothetical protein
MSADALTSDPPDSGESSQGARQRGRLFQPGSAGVTRGALNFYRAGDPDFTGEYFPNVANRGYATYDDVFTMDDRQAASLVPILYDSICHFWVQDGRDKRRNTHLIERIPIDPAYESSAAKKAKMWTAALRDLCSIYGLECPV